MFYTIIAIIIIISFIGYLITKGLEDFMGKIKKRSDVIDKLKNNPKFQKRLDDIKKNPKKYFDVATEKTDACEHKTLKQFIPKTAWYRCSTCKMMFFLAHHDAWPEASFKKLMLEINKKILKEKK